MGSFSASLLSPGTHKAVSKPHNQPLSLVTSLGAGLGGQFLPCRARRGTPTPTPLQHPQAAWSHPDCHLPKLCCQDPIWLWVCSLRPSCFRASGPQSECHLCSLPRFKPHISPTRPAWDRGSGISVCSARAPMGVHPRGLHPLPRPSTYWWYGYSGCDPYLLKTVYGSLLPSHITTNSLLWHLRPHVIWPQSSFAAPPSTFSPSQATEISS